MALDELEHLPLAESICAYPIPAKDVLNLAYADQTQPVIDRIEIFFIRWAFDITTEYN